MISVKEAYKNKLNMVTMIITNRCNLRCSYCFEKDKGLLDMPVDMAIDIVDATYRHIPVDKGVFTYNMFGGEPMLNWKVIKAVADHINKNKMNAKIGITSNMTILTDEMIDYIDDNDFFILASFDGIKSVQNKHRGGFDTVYANTKKLIDRGLGHLIEVRMTVLPDTVHRMVASVMMFIDMGINNICPLPSTDCEWSKEDIAKYKEEYIKLLNLYSTLLNDHSNKRNIAITTVDNILWKVLEEEVMERGMCAIGQPEWMSIDFNGNIYPCHSFSMSGMDTLSEYLIGNIYTGVDVNKFGELPVRAKFGLDRCTDCSGKYICQNGCTYQNIIENGELYTPTAAYCDIKKVQVDCVKDFRYNLLNATNIRSRQLNIIRENMKVKQYFDNEIKNNNPFEDKTFMVKINHFGELQNNLKVKDNLIPEFEQYFSINLSRIFAIVKMLKDNMIKDRSEDIAKL